MKVGGKRGHQGTCAGKVMGVLVSRASQKAWSVRREEIGKGGRHRASQDICEIFTFHMEKFHD